MVDVNLSLAVDLNGGGLAAPVIKNVAALRVPDLARAIARIAARARSNALKPDDMTEVAIPEWLRSSLAPRGPARGAWRVR